MSVLGISPRGAGLDINKDEVEQLLSPTDQAIKAKAIGLLGKHPLRDTVYASLLGAISGAVVGAAVFLTPTPNYGQSALTALPAGFIGGAIGAAVASIAHRIILNGKKRPILETIPAMVGASLTILSIGNVVSWQINNEPMELWMQFLAGVLSSGTAVAMNSSIYNHTKSARRNSSAGFFLGLGVGSATGLGAGVGLGMLLPSIGPSLGGMYGCFAGMAGALGVFDLSPCY